MPYHHNESTEVRIVAAVFLDLNNSNDECRRQVFTNDDEDEDDVGRRAVGRIGAEIEQTIKAEIERLRMNAVEVVTFNTCGNVNATASRIVALAADEGIITQKKRAEICPGTFFAGKQNL